MAVVMSGNNFWLSLMLFGVVLSSTMALQCLKCGQYNDGVGSITPCINYTHMQLIDCPSKDHVFCIKYISEGSTVRDCVADCTEKENWSARTYCCQEDGCNASPKTIESYSMVAYLIGALATMLTSLLVQRIH